MHLTAMYDCMPCGERCENRWFCMHGTTCLRHERKKLPRVDLVPTSQPPTATHHATAAINYPLLLPWTGDNND